MRSVEIALFLVPVAMIVAWFFGVRGLSPRGTLAIVVTLVTLGIALFWFGDNRAVIGRYVPAQWHGGAVVPERGSPTPR